MSEVMTLPKDNDSSSYLCNTHCYACPLSEGVSKILNGGYASLLPRKNISEKKIRALCFFYKNLGKVVTKDELLEHIWPGGVVGNGSIAVLICELRSLLWHTNFKIETVRGRGYIFLKVSLQGNKDATMLHIKQNRNF